MRRTSQREELSTGTPNPQGRMQERTGSAGCQWHRYWADTHDEQRERRGGEKERESTKTKGGGKQRWLHRPGPGQSEDGQEQKQRANRGCDWRQGLFGASSYIRPSGKREGDRRRQERRGKAGHPNQGEAPAGTTRWRRGQGTEYSEPDDNLAWSKSAISTKRFA